MLTPIHEANLIRNLTGSFVCVLAYSLLAYIIIIYPLEGDKASSLASMFGFAATLYAPIGAFFLIDNWKIQKKYDLENNTLSSILLNLRPIYLELHIIRSDSNNLKKIDESFILKTDYIKRKRLIIFNEVINLYSDIKVYSEIKKDKKLVELYNVFDKKCFVLNGIYEELFLKRYREYYEKNLRLSKESGNEVLDYYNIFRAYNSDKRKNALAIQIAEVLKMFKEDSVPIHIDKEQKYITYYDWINETIDLHDQIQAYCIEKLHP